MKRPHTMRARAEAAEVTRQRILGSAAGLLRVRLRSDIRLEDVARDAGVSVPTVLRVFGNRAPLLDLALDETLRMMRASLHRPDPGDVTGSVSAWFDHYEEFGDVVMRNLAAESDPAVAPIAAIGRERHREYVERQFAPWLDSMRIDRRDRLVDALVCVCDVYTWKLLRRDMKRPRPEAEATMTLMIESLLGGG